MKLIGRSEWGAVHGAGAPVPRRPVSRVVVHHSKEPDIPAGTPLEEVHRRVGAIERFHVQTNGWHGIGYNFMVDQDGRAIEGRGWGRAGAHAGNAAVNQDSVGLCFLIDGEVHEPSEAAWTAAAELIREGVERGEIVENFRVTGHRDHRSTTCPGDAIYDQLDRLRHLEFADPMVGRRLWSAMHGYIVVTSYRSDTEWTFVPVARLEELGGTPAGTPLSRMPEHPG
jgi:hypothetical protein